MKGCFRTRTYQCLDVGGGGAAVAGKESENIPTIYSLLMTNDGRASEGDRPSLPSFRIGLLVISMMALLLHCCCSIPPTAPTTVSVSEIRRS